MKPSSILIPAAMILAAAFALPAGADPGNGNGNGKGKGAHGRHDAPAHRQIAHCPPGLAKKDPPCIPPGQARKQVARYGHRVGEILRVGDYVLVRDPRRLDLETRPGWSYYRDEDRLYRVDSGTRKILAVLELISAFSD